MDTSDHGLSHHFKGPGAVPNGLTGITHVLVKCLFILSVSRIHQGFKFPTVKKIKYWVNTLLGCTSKTSLDVNFFPCFGVENSLLEMIQCVTFKGVQFSIIFI